MAGEDQRDSHAQITTPSLAHTEITPRPTRYARRRGAVQARRASARIAQGFNELAARCIRGRTLCIWRRAYESFVLDRNSPQGAAPHATAFCRSRLIFSSRGRLALPPA